MNLLYYVVRNWYFVYQRDNENMIQERWMSGGSMILKAYQTLTDFKVKYSFQYCEDGFLLWKGKTSFYPVMKIAWSTVKICCACYKVTYKECVHGLPLLDQPMQWVARWCCFALQQKQGQSISWISQNVELFKKNVGAQFFYAVLLSFWTQLVFSALL